MESPVCSAAQLQGTECALATTNKDGYAQHFHRHKGLYDNTFFSRSSSKSCCAFCLDSYHTGQSWTV
eukprot:765251-Hanusia_phi.AAC.2